MRARIAAFFTAPGFDDYPFSVALYRKVYAELGDAMERMGGQLFLVRGQESYRGGQTFSHAWEYGGASFTYVEGPITFDLIWNRGALRVDDDAAVINDPALESLTRDKWRTYQLFPHLHPFTVRVENPRQRDEALLRTRAARVVAKPVDGEGGHGVFIESPAEVCSVVSSFPYLLQDFLDTSAGIPGIVDGLHDLRVILLSGEIGLCYVRTPPPGMLTANVSRGGREIEVKAAVLPWGAREVVSTVEEQMRRFPTRLYSIDMGLDRGGEWKVFELNSQPSFSTRETGPTYLPFQEQLAAFLLRHCRPAR